VLPVVAGISGTDYEQPAAFSDGFRIAVIVCAGLLLAGALIAAVTIRNPGATPHVRSPDRRHYCGVEGPPLQAPDGVAATGPH
jgi:hypothetical protein